MMGTQQRYKVPMFDTTYRIVREVHGSKDEMLFGSNALTEAEAKYDELAVGSTTTIFLMHRTRILRRSDEK